MIYSLLAVALGGAVGSVLRFALTAALASYWPRHAFLATLAVNLLGCFVIGLLSAWFVTRVDLSPALRAGLTAGLLGGLTTFSTFSLEVLRLFESGQLLSAALYLLTSLIGGLLAAWWGLSLLR